MNGIVTLCLPSSTSPAAQASAGSSRLRELVFGPENLLATAAIEACFTQRAASGRIEGRSNFEVQPEAPPLVVHGSTAEFDRPFPAAMTRPSPLVLYGPPGSGKTHIVEGMANVWRRRWPDDHIVSIPAVDFVRQMHDAAETRTVGAWRASLRSCQLLALEDIGQLAGQTGAQIELVHMLDTLAEQQAQVLVTSRLPLDQLPDLLPGLRSRLELGLVVGLELPKAATRRALVERLAAQRRMKISAEALDILAAGIDGNVPELLGALVFLETAAELEGISLDAAQASRLVSRRSGLRTPSLRGIAAQTARHFSLRVPDLKSASRRRAIVLARGVAMYLSRQLTDKSLEQIGDYFGGRDHTTVLHGCRKTEELITTDPLARQAVVELRNTLSRR